MMEAIVALAIIVVVIQMGLSVYQLRYYDKFIRQLVQKYANSKGYELKTETSSNMLKTVIVAVIFDDNNIIIEAHEIKGNTIFSKFKPMKKLVNIEVNEALINELEIKKKNLQNKALLKLLNKKMRTIADE